MRNRLQTQAGYSLIELMLVVGIMGVVTGIAVVQIGASKQGLNGDGAMRVVLSQLNQGKQLAITQRRNIRVTFDANNSVQIIREEVPGPILTTISSVPFEGGAMFARITSPNLGEPPPPELPAPTGGLVAAVAFGTATQMRFTPEGVFVDQDGNTLNGTLFIALPGQPMSARAITVFGSTGRIRGFRWDGSSWKVV
jgi:prepilin-type N-terminal cleavage/methylation domain-containing protein